MAREQKGSAAASLRASDKMHRARGLALSGGGTSLRASDKMHRARGLALSGARRVVGMCPSLVEGERLSAGCLVGDTCGVSPFFSGSLRAIGAFSMDDMHQDPLGNEQV